MTRRLTVRAIRRPSVKCRALPSESFERTGIVDQGRTGDAARCRQIARVMVEGVPLCRNHAAECVLAEVFDGNAIELGSPT